MSSVLGLRPDLSTAPTMQLVVITVHTQRMLVSVVDVSRKLYHCKVIWHSKLYTVVYRLLHLNRFSSAKWSLFPRVYSLARFSVLPSYLFCSIQFYIENSKTITLSWFQLGDKQLIATVVLWSPNGSQCEVYETQEGEASSRKWKTTEITVMSFYFMKEHLTDLDRQYTGNPCSNYQTLQ